MITEIDKDNISVADLAKITKLSVDQLTKILIKAGIEVSSADMVMSQKAKSLILEHLRPAKKRATIGLKKKVNPQGSASPAQALASNPPKDNKILSLDKKFGQQQSRNKKFVSTTVKISDEKATPAKALSVEEVLASRARTTIQEKQVTTPKSQPEANKDTSPRQTITLPETMSVETLASKLHRPSTDIIKVFFELGEMVTVNQMISFDQAEVVLDSFNCDAVVEQAPNKVDEDSPVSDDEPVDLQPRAAIVTIMGHVDHGKTSLLDFIRNTKVAAKEAGGITQHIGAYQVDTSHGTITFLDTPGHEAFTAMRSRGADITDIVILVVAANDGVMPQTVEAIQHAKAASVPIIVAVNKIDRDDADPEKIRTELSKHDVLPESWGGDVIFQDISAKTGQNVNQLLDSVALQAEMMELKANVAGRASASVIETRLDKGLGPTATILVTQGIFKQGMIVLAGEQYGKIRTMRDSHNSIKKVANPSEAVEITGLSSPPQAGDQVIHITTEREAKELASSRQARTKLLQNQRTARARAESLMSKKQGDEHRVLPVIVKTDVHGSLEALSETLRKSSFAQEHNTTIQIIAGNIGGISSSDIHLAKASDAVIIAFNVRPDPAAKKLLISEQVTIEYFSIIYDVIDYINNQIEGLNKPTTEEVVLGSALVKDIFRSSKFGTISGCEVQDGIIKRNANARIIRDQKAIFNGKIESLRRFSDSVNEIKSGLECGIGIKGYSDIKVGDVIEAYQIIDHT